MPMGHIWLFSFAVLVLYVTVIECALPEGTCQPLVNAPLSQCHTVIQGDVFVPKSASLSSLDSLIAKKTGAFRLGLTSADCTEDAMRFLCSEAFRPCTQIPGPEGTTLSIPASTCRERCDGFVTNCRSTLLVWGSEIPDCYAINPTTGRTVYPTSPVVIQLSPDKGIAIPCSNPSPKSAWSEIPRATCRPPLTAADTPLSKCHMVVRDPVYIPDSLTLAEIDQRASVNNALARTNSVSERCAENMMNFVCAEAFRTCNYATVNPQLPQVLLPSSTCYSNCWDFRHTCGKELAGLAAQGKINANPINCEVASPRLGGQPQYPPQTTAYYFPTANVTATVPCQHPEVQGEYYLPRCEPFAGYPKECAGIVTWDVYIPSGTTQEQIAARTRVALAKTQTLPTSCQEKTVRMACASNFLRCERQALSPAAGINFPSFVCKSLCLEAQRQCGKFDAPIPCDGLTATGLEIFPTEGTTVVANGRSFFTPCHVPEYLPGGYVERDSCPDPFILTEDDEFVCEIACPRKSLKDEQLLGHMIITTILAYLGLFFGSIAFISLSLHPLKRTFPKNVINFQILAATLMVIAFWLSHLVYGDGPAYRNVWCSDNHTIARRDVSVCAAQSFFMYVFNLSLVSWYLVVAIMMLRAVLNVNISPKLKWPLIITIHSLCWGVPTIIWIILISTDSIASFGSFPCFIDADLWGRYLAEVVFWYPITIMLALGLVIITISTGYTIYRTGKRGLRKQVRLMLYLLYNFAANSWIVFYHYYVFGRRDYWVENFTEWAVCSATSLHECELRGGMEFWLYIIQGIVYSSQPLILAMIVLLDREIWYWWRDAIRRHILRQKIDDRAEAMKRVRAVQARLEKTPTSGSSSAASGLGWGVDD